MASEPKAKDTPPAKPQAKVSPADRHLANLKTREKLLLAKQERLSELKSYDDPEKAAERVTRHLGKVRQQIKEASK